MHCIKMKMNSPQNHKETAAASYSCCYTYMLLCSDNTYYTGWTTDLTQRIAAHNKGTGSKYTRARLPVTLAYAETYETKSEAMKREAAIKKLPRKEKEALAASFSGIPSSVPQYNK